MNATEQQNRDVIWLEDVRIDDIPLVGGKNASLGEMISRLAGMGIRVPGGFAVTARAYRDFIEHNRLTGQLTDLMSELDQGQPLHSVGERVRSLIENGSFPPALEASIRTAYTLLGERSEQADPSVAVRSSATAEDLPEASFAGQQETFLNVEGPDDLLEAVRRCFASLFTDRAITYRVHHGFAHMSVSLSVAVQTMVRSDSGSSGVAFTLDTETGFPNIVLINGAWGLGENVVKGVVNPDEFRVFKPLLASGFLPIIDRRLGSKELKMVYGERGTVNVETTPDERARFVLTDERAVALAMWCAQIEEHYDKPMDIEWAVDGQGEMWIVQARPETVHSSKMGHRPMEYTLSEKGRMLVEGVAVGNKIASGKTFVLRNMDEAARFEDGGILVAEMTDPDWVPIMKRASGIVTNFGGRTSHAAIVSRELGIAAIVGTGTGTSDVPDGVPVTLCCAHGATGTVYEGALAFEARELSIETLKTPPTRIMLNVGDPEAALRYWRLPVQGIGLARLEFIIEHQIKVHPMALVRFDQVEDRDARAQIEEITDGWDDKPAYFVDHLAGAIGKLAASQYPEPVVVRTSDFKSNEYADLIGGHSFEPVEQNPMIGFRGASRYDSPLYREAFALECEALRRVRDEMGFDNVIVMIPFCRTLAEADRVLAVMADNGLERGKNGLHVYVMAEIPANVILAKQFAERFDGFSIGSNDLTQLVLGVDRDNALLSEVFDERDPAVRQAIEDLVRVAHDAGTTVGICGQAPSDHPDFAEFLVELGIDSISLNPDSVVGVIERIT